MRITICAYDAPGNIDGPTAWLKRLIPFLKERSVQVRVIFIAANSKRLPFLNELKKDGYECTLIPWDLFFEEKIMAILEDLRTHPPDVFIPNYFPSACYAAQWAKLAGIPSVIILHNDNAMHHALVDEFAAGHKERKVSAVIAVSKFLKQKIDEKKVTGVITEYITYGAPVPVKKANRLASDPLKLIYAGRLNEHQKRISDVTLALCAAAREVSGTECMIYGSGEALESVLQIIDEKGKGLPVKYGGVLKSNEVQDHLLQNHVYVLLSDYEGLPISLMEAMAAGLVPVCTNMKSGVGEVIENRKNGFLINDRDREFIKVIKELKTDLALWQTCSNEARSTIIHDFSQEVCNDKWLLMLKRVAATSSYSGNIPMPSLPELKAINTKTEFNSFDTRMPGPLQIPFYRLKKRMGRLKRSLFGNY
jgi:colanic acid/amylovoran biosynthesis glycosyltransferase